MDDNNNNPTGEDNDSSPSLEIIPPSPPSTELAMANESVPSIILEQTNSEGTAEDVAPAIEDTTQQKTEAAEPGSSSATIDAESNMNASNASSGAGASSSEIIYQRVIREQDQFLPIANISRIMKKAVPQSSKMSKDAKTTMQECTTEFILFIAGEAVERCYDSNRKTLTGEDVLWAMKKLGFDTYVEPLKLFLSKYREAQKHRPTNKLNETEQEDGITFNFNQYQSSIPNQYPPPPPPPPQE